MDKVIVLGAGESGVGAAVLAKKMGCEVFLSEYGSIAENYKSIIVDWGINYEEGGHTRELFEGGAVCIKSPGIADSCDIVHYVKELGMEVISEIEFAARYSDAKFICITGSNGKSTTTTLIYNILNRGGYNVGLGGNIGKSFAYQVATESYDWYVLELSSFQLDGMKHFKADIAVLTNITPDHLDRYDHSFELYTKSKFRIIQNMGSSDTFIYSMDDKATISYILENRESFTMPTVPFSVNQTLLEGACLNENNQIEINLLGHDELYIDREQVKLLGVHNIYNIMAAAMAAIKAGVDSESILSTIYNFEGVEHRMEQFCEKDGVIYINDSKATNVDSVYFAMSGLTRPVVWIAGGTDKGNDYEPLISAVKGKVTTLICMGLDNDALIESFTGIIPYIYSTASLEEAIAKVRTVYKSGDCVILSPACASFDLFKNYEDRGRKFKEAILAMEPKHK
ncbi:MAG: UDP-N-acetylmuramoyl-L-alanine--D-glutamate ligase [Rikenellaceae bacterium]